MARLVAIVPLVLLLALALAGQADARGKPRVAAIQVALMSRGLYHGTIDGYAGPMTRNGVRRFQERRGLAADGIVGRRTRRAFGRLGRPLIGRRLIHSGMVGFDVSELQFMLAWHGFPSGNFDGGFGPRTRAALFGFQRYARLVPDGVAGPATVRALRRRLPRSPIRLRRPVSAPVGDGFGPRGARFHAGVDFPAAKGTPVRAARSGWVVFAGRADGFGKLVEINHVRGVATWYAHLSRILVRPGWHVRAGRIIGRVGATGEATGPHLHLQVMVRGAATNPLTALR